MRHGKHEQVTNPAGNTRNGKSQTTLKGEFGALPIEASRDRHGSFEPQLIPKHKTPWTACDDKILRCMPAASRYGKSSW